MDRNRFGRFFIRRAAVDDGLADFVYREVVPFEVRYRIDLDAYEVGGWCDQFAEMERGPAPWYKVSWVPNEMNRPTERAIFTPAVDEAEASKFWWETT